MENPEIKKAVSVLEESAFTDAQLLGYEKFWDIISVEKTLYGSGGRRGLREGREAGKEEGIREGIEEGRKEGIKEGEKRGIKLTKKVFQLSQKGCTIAQIAEKYNTEESELKEILE